MEKYQKRMIILCTLIMLCGFSSKAYARSYICDSCGTGTVQIVSSYTMKDVHLGQTECTRKKNALDEVFYETVTEHTEKCNNCGITYKYVVYGDLKIICNH